MKHNGTDPLAIHLSSEPLLTLDHEGMKNRARSHLDRGAVVDVFPIERHALLKLLNDALATELVCVLRYRNHHFMSPSIGGIAGFAVSEELMKHSQEELAHADLLAARITQLGGQPDFSPDGLSRRSHTETLTTDSLRAMLTDDLVAERVAIESYGSMIRFVGERDSTTRRMLEGILSQEEEHASDLADFLRRLPIDD